VGGCPGSFSSPLPHQPMMYTGMRHIDGQHQTGDANAVSEELAATRRETNHFWNIHAIDTTHPPATAAHLGEAQSVAVRPNPPATDPIAPAVGDTLRVAPTTSDPLAVLRQNLIDLRTTDDTTSRTLRDIIDLTHRIGVDV
jgi:hypothetical protein